MSLDISHCGDNQSGVRGDYGCAQQIVASHNVDSYDTVYSQHNGGTSVKSYNQQYTDNTLNHVYYSISAVPSPNVQWLRLDYNLWIGIIEFLPTKDLLRFKRCCKYLYNISILPICWLDREYEYTQHSDSNTLNVNEWLQYVTTALYHVEKLSLSDTGLDDRGVEYMCRLPFLHSINIANTNITDIGLNRIINTYPHLHAINIIETKVSSVGLRLLSSNRSLRSLAVSNSKVIDRHGWSCLAHIRELSHLDITSVGTHKSTMNILGSIVSRDPPCSKLTRLSLHVQSNSELDLLAQFPNIMELQVEIYGQWLDAEPVNWDKFIHKETIHCLSIPYAKLCDNDLKYIAANRTMKSLHIDLNSPEYTDVGVKYVSQMTQLTELSLAAVNITDKAFAYLHKMTELTTLSITRGHYAPNPLQLTDQALQYIAGIKSLTMLRLAGIDSLTDSGLQYLVHASKLRKLVIERCCQLTESGVHQIRLQNKYLQALKYDAVDLNTQYPKYVATDQTATATDRMDVEGVHRDN